jgi:TolB-like protein
MLKLIETKENKFIRAEVGRIVKSEIFARSPRMRRFLEFIVDETLCGRSEQLSEYVIGVEVYERGNDFEPAVDPIVRNDARRLRFKLLEYYQSAPVSSGSVMIEIPKGGYVPAFVSRKISSAVNPTTRKRLGVMPFECLSDSSEFVGRALCMSLTAGLTNQQGMDAVAHGFLRELPLRDAASQMQLSHVIHGTILQSEDEYRIIVNLIQVLDGLQLWAREFHFESGRISRLHSEITQAVLTEVSAHLDLVPTATPLFAIAA